MPTKPSARSCVLCITLLYISLLTDMASNGTGSRLKQLFVSEMCGTIRRSTNMLTSGRLVATKVLGVRSKIVLCTGFIEVGA